MDKAIDSCALKIACGHVWGGIKDSDQDIETSALRASLYSRSCSGGKGGDIYYFSVCQGDVLTRVVVADVVGHGQEVSKVSDTVYRSMLKHMNNAESHAMLVEWNRSIDDQNIQVLTTAVVSGVQIANKKLHYSYAGHHPVLICKKSSSYWDPIAVESFNGANYPLGIDREAKFDQGDQVVLPGDKIFLYTDGLIEAPDSSGDQYGMERLMTVLESSQKESNKQIKTNVLDSVRQFTGGHLDHDDITLMAIEF
jgi:sigma-B regulation protein RsbU (phosphoserine phosphatase)